MDDADDINVNPVLLFKIDTAKRKARSRKRAKIAATGAGNVSGGLKRLGFSMEPTQKEVAMGKAKNMMDVEKFLQGQQGVDVQEGAAKKQTVAGKKKVNVVAAATMAGNSNNLGEARAQARAAAKAAKIDEEDDEDEGDRVPKPKKNGASAEL